MKISKDQVIYTMSKDNEPAAHCQSGDTIIFETCDCFHDTVQSPEDVISHVDFNHINPATGPLYVEGAEVGDALKVEILAIDLADQGSLVASPGLGRLEDRIEKEQTIICPVKDDQVFFMDQAFPLRKMIGVIGTTPAAEPISTGTPHDHGGNMDCTAISEGASLYLPVNTPGGLLSMGDLHASMGDGEIMGSGIEIAGQVRIKVSVIKDYDFALPFIESPDLYISLGSRETMEEASDLAISNMADFIMKKTDLTLEEAGMFLSAFGDLKVCQIVDPNKTMRMEVKKEDLDALAK